MTAIAVFVGRHVQVALHHMCQGLGAGVAALSGDRVEVLVGMTDELHGLHQSPVADLLVEALSGQEDDGTAEVSAPHSYRLGDLF